MSLFFFFRLFYGAYFEIPWVFIDVSEGSADEMNRGYFADISELNQHGGKVLVQLNTAISSTGLM